MKNLYKRFQNTIRVFSAGILGISSIILNNGWVMLVLIGYIVIVFIEDFARDYQGIVK